MLTRSTHHCRIIVNGVTLHTSTAITTIGSNSKLAHRFLEPYAIMERIQVTGFFVQELILSGLYVYKARAFLGWRGGRKSRTKAHQKLRLMMTHLIVSNVIVVARTFSLSLSLARPTEKTGRGEISPPLPWTSGPHILPHVGIVPS